MLKISYPFDAFKVNSKLILNIEKAIGLTSEKSVTICDVGLWAKYLGYDVPEPNVVLDIDYAMGLNNLDLPILFGRPPGFELMPIDGHHRLYKAYKVGMVHLPCYVLSAQETLECVV